MPRVRDAVGHGGGRGHHGHRRYRGHHGHHGYDRGYVGFSFGYPYVGFSVGYPYLGFSSAGYGYPYYGYTRLGYGYPYYGYYSYGYPYYRPYYRAFPYLEYSYTYPYDYVDCYNGYYTSGYRAYPWGNTYIYANPGVEGGPNADDGNASRPRDPARVITAPKAEAEASSEGAVDAQAALLEDLNPGQLSFAMGMISFKSGRYDEAVDSFFNATVADPKSKIVKIFLATALFATGEYRYSAEYLRLGLEDWPQFPSYWWNVQNLYTNQEDLKRQIALLREEVRLVPSSTDALLVLGFVGYTLAPPQEQETFLPGRAFHDLQTYSEDPIDQSIAAGYLAADRQVTPPSSEEARVERFLTTLDTGQVKTLPID